MAFLTKEELHGLGLNSLGEDVLISEFARLYNPKRISIGNNVRIDDFCILSAGERGITLGSHIHIAAYSSIIGKGNITLDDYCNISSRVSIYSSSDDYSGNFMTSPVVKDIFSNVDNSPVKLNKHCIIGCNSVVLPGTIMEQGVAVGALSLVKGRLQEFTIYAGSPAKIIRPRARNLLKLENEHRIFYETQSINK